MIRLSKQVTAETHWIRKELVSPYWYWKREGMGGKAFLYHLKTESRKKNRKWDITVQPANINWFRWGSLMDPETAGQENSEKQIVVHRSVVSNSLRYQRLCSPPGSSVHGILQARILEWVAMPFSKGPSWPRDPTPVSCIADGFSTI